MTKQITPPPELVREWAWGCSPYDVPADHIATHAARWGADQELEACCEWLPSDLTINGKSLRDVRRPKPPTLKEQALESLHHLEAGCEPNIDLLRRALEALPDD